MHILVKIEGEKVTEIDRSSNQQFLEQERDRMTAASFAGMGPGSMAKLRFGVRAA